MEKFHIVAQSMVNVMSEKFNGVQAKIKNKFPYPYTIYKSIFAPGGVTLHQKNLQILSTPASKNHLLTI